MLGDCSHLAGLGRTRPEFAGNGSIVFDSGYKFYEWEDYLLDTLELQLQIPRKSNSKRVRKRWLEIHKSLFRKYIETTICEIGKLFPKQIYAPNPNVFLLKIALFLSLLHRLV